MITNQRRQEIERRIGQIQEEKEYAPRAKLAALASELSALYEEMNPAHQDLLGIEEQK